MVPLSMLRPVDKLELLVEWADFELGLERNGLCQGASRKSKERSSEKMGEAKVRQ